MVVSGLVQTTCTIVKIAHENGLEGLSKGVGGKIPEGFLKGLYGQI